MPPFVSTKCPNCHHQNRYDLAELLKNDTNLVRGFTYLDDEEIVVTCQRCEKKFKFVLNGDEYGS